MEEMSIDRNIQINTVREVIAKRRSVRHYSDDSIPLNALEALVEAGIQAPSGSNWQNQRFLIVDDKEEIMRIGKSRFVWPYKGANQTKVKRTHPGGIIGGSAALIIVFADSLDNDRRGNGEYFIWENLEIQNCSASIENILILATAMSIGSCWVSASDSMNYTRMFSGKSWRHLFSNYNIPEYYKLQGIIMLGYPKAVDEKGFPVGAKKHGATVWQSTERKPLDYYLIKKRQPGVSEEIQMPVLDQYKLRMLSRLLRWLQKGSRWCDKKIHRIEILKHLNP